MGMRVSALIQEAGKDRWNGRCKNYRYRAYVARMSFIFMSESRAVTMFRIITANYQVWYHGYLMPPIQLDGVEKPRMPANPYVTVNSPIASAPKPESNPIFS